MGGLTMGQIVLSVEFYCSDLDKTLSIREWFMEMVKTLWVEQEGFSGKRPFGNSGWHLDPVIALIEAGMVDGEIEISTWNDREYKQLVDFDRTTYMTLMFEAVSAL